MSSFLRNVLAGMLLAVVLSGVSEAQRMLQEGELAHGDEKRSTGQYVDRHSIETRQGQPLVVEVTSEEFDTYVIVVTPSGQEIENDDWLGSTERSRIEIRETEEGLHSVLVSSFKKGEKGTYSLIMDTSGKGLGEESPELEMGKEVRGRLSEGDGQLTSGEFKDGYDFSGTGEGYVRFELTSDDFDTYLIVVDPGKAKHENDDFGGSATMSRLDLPMSSGIFRVIVTSFEPGETGEYRILVSEGEADQVLRILQMGDVVEGELKEGDDCLSSGEFKDSYTFRGEGRGLVSFELESTDFDPYLMVWDPSGEKTENDDFEGSSRLSRIDLPLSEGNYSIGVTSYESGETGKYTLRIVRKELPAPSPGERITRQGRLEEGDETLSSGEFVDRHKINASLGNPLVVHLNSDDFDTYLIAVSPSGKQLDNDDWEGTTGSSRIEIPVAEEGAYSIMVTSYGKGETGSYTLILDTTGQDLKD